MECIPLNHPTTRAGIKVNKNSQNPFRMTGVLNPFRAPEPLPILNPSNFVPKYGFPVVKGLNQNRRQVFFFFWLFSTLYIHNHGVEGGGIGAVALYFASNWYILVEA